MARPTDLPTEILSQVCAIEPSHDGELAYFPCSVRLRDGSVHPRVAFVDAASFARHWGVLPERGMLNARDVLRVDDTPHRLPPAFANALYKAGESGMGYCVFVLRFRDGSEHPYLTGNAIDFLDYPAGHGAADIVGVVPHTGRGAEAPLHHSPFEWCPVLGLDAATGNGLVPWWKFWHRAPAT